MSQTIKAKPPTPADLEIADDLLSSFNVEDDEESREFLRYVLASETCPHEEVDELRRQKFFDDVCFIDKKMFHIWILLFVLYCIILYYI